MNISAIGADGGNNDWLRKKLLERQAQKGMQGPEQANKGQQAPQSQQLNQVQNIDSVNKASAAMGSKGPQGAPPWASLMSQLGISATGSKEGDMSAIGQKLELMKTNASDPAKKAELESLEQSYEAIQSQSSSMQPPTQPLENKEGQASQMVGFEQLGDLNKHMLVKKKFMV